MKYHHIAVSTQQSKRNTSIKAGNDADQFWTSPYRDNCGVQRKRNLPTSLRTGGRRKKLKRNRRSPEIESMEYLIRLAQMHETFRRPELESLAELHNVDLEILEYSDEV
jgi:hypothetical protein